MVRGIRPALLTAAAACALFAGIVAANAAGECPDLNTSNCVVMDMTYQDQCCVDWDSSGPRVWTCTREVYDCIDERGYTPGQPGGPYDCTAPQGFCN